MKAGEMLKVLHKVEDELPDLLREPIEAWQSLDIAYDPPRVERLWRPWKEHRLYLHRIHGCADALYHPHPWPSAVRVVTGSYEMGLSHSTTILSGNVLSGSNEIARLVLGPESEYEMIHPHGWHYVKPLPFRQGTPVCSCCGCEPVLSVMVTARPWDPPVFDHSQFGKSANLKPLDPKTKEELRSLFREEYHYWRASTQW